MVVVREPVELAHHGTQGSDEEGGPFVVVDEVLWRCGGGGGVEGVGGVVSAEEVVDHGHGFPGDDAGVGVFCEFFVVLASAGIGSHIPDDCACRWKKALVFSFFFWPAGGAGLIRGRGGTCSA